MTIVVIVLIIILGLIEVRTTVYPCIQNVPCMCSRFRTCKLETRATYDDDVPVCSQAFCLWSMFLNARSLCHILIWCQRVVDVRHSGAMSEFSLCDNRLSFRLENQRDLQGVCLQTPGRMFTGQCRQHPPHLLVVVTFWEISVQSCAALSLCVQLVHPCACISLHFHYFFCQFRWWAWWEEEACPVFCL